jgi:hypothetical protein
VLALISLAFPAVVGVEGFHLFAMVDTILIVLPLIALLVYMEIVRQSGATARESVDLLKRPLFLVGVVICGILAPLTLLIASAFVSDIALLVAAEGVAGMLILLGGLLLRYNVVTCGIRLEVG